MGFASVGLFATSRSTVMLAIILLLSLSAQNGGVAFLSIYALKVASLTPTLLGLLQSAVLGSTVVGLMIVMPLLLRCVALPRLLVLSCLDAVICWTLMSLATLAWQLYALAAGGVVEQLSNLLGTPVVNGIYQATVSTEFTIGSIRVNSIACLGVAAMYLIATIAGLLVKEIPREEEAPRDSVLGSLVSDCRDEVVSGVPQPV